MINSKKYNILVCGHTHKRQPESSGMIKDIKETFVLNPGPAHRKNTSISGLFDQIGRIIIFDTQSKGYEFVDLSK
ncbi:MAG: hypothetical protein ACTHKF_08825 [Candidatus Nitrosocosmicus sp.]